MEDQDLVGLVLGKWTVESISGQKITLKDGDETMTMSKGRFKVLYESAERKFSEDEYEEDC